jgi:mannose-6-phosphate isomerase-like protein (cupin superfamily)
MKQEQQNLARDAEAAPVVLDLEACETNWEITTGRTVRGYGFNGQVPGPTIEASIGDTVLFRLKNSLPEPTSIHWHGLRIPAVMDGTNAVRPGETFEYRFRLPEAGTFWYHPHVNEMEQLERVLYGAIIVRGPDEPTLDDERVLMLDDLKLNRRGRLARSGEEAPGEYLANGTRYRKEIVRTEEEKMEKGVSQVPPGEGGKPLWVFGELVTYKITSDQTGGAYSLFEVASQPGEGGQPPHVQHREDEAFYVLEGEYEFVVEGRTMRVGAGSLIYVPRGNLHAHKNTGEVLGRLLVSQTPGGLHERFFERIGQPVAGESWPPVSEDPQDMRRIRAIAAEYGIKILLTPPVGQVKPGEPGARSQPLPNARGVRD